MEVWLNQYWQSFRTVYAVPKIWLKVIALSFAFPAYVFFSFFVRAYSKHGHDLLSTEVMLDGTPPIFTVLTPILLLCGFLWAFALLIIGMCVVINKQTVWQKNASFLLMFGGMYFLVNISKYWFALGTG